jgi:protein-S-isoprenylcysteine O-methyltransferase Ste14
MQLRPHALFAVIWIGWIVSWIAAAFWSDRTQARAALSRVWFHRVIMTLGAVLMLPWAARQFGALRLWHVGLGGADSLAGLTLAGILFAWWARIHIGRLWSGSITRKEGHRIVDTGPYALVRHPIYTGLITALLASAIAQATLTALIGSVLVSFGLWLKARVEERFLMAELGAEAYAAYRGRD